MSQMGFRYGRGAEEARDAALEQVADNAEPWTERAIRYLTWLRATASLQHPFTGEDMRWYVDAYVGPPHHHNAYGALTRIAIRRGLIRPTGQWTKMQSMRSHARQTPLYVWVS